MSTTMEDVMNRYPIHWLVWNNQYEELKKAVEAKQFSSEDIELRDPRGRTPLLLAVTLGYIESVKVLIDAGADVNCEKDGWTAVQEATATGNAELLSLVLSKRDYLRHVLRSCGIPDLLHQLSLAPDFYVEMKWEFTSWVPLVSRMCPFDTYKVYKRGGNVRVDTTLVGFENNRWQRGDRTYIFRGEEGGASLVELDHELGTVWTERLRTCRNGQRPEPPVAPPRRSLAQRLAAPLALNYLDTDKISFERNKCGIWGWRQDKRETVNGYECKVFSANNVELVSKTRTEHLSQGARFHPRTSPRAPLAPLHGLLALADTDTDNNADTAVVDGDGDEPLITPDKGEPSNNSKSQEVLCPVTWEEYFSSTPLDKDIGKPKDVTTKVQKFKATLWLCEDYPLKLQEQIMPILDLMAAMSSPHFAKLKDFIEMQLPSGFPVKIEIPLFHVLNARITFGNIMASESPVAGVSRSSDGSCVLSSSCLSATRGALYRDADERLLFALDDDERLLQYAIQQSLMEPGTHDDQVDVWEALRGARPSSPAAPRSDPLSPRAPRSPHLPHDMITHEERQLQRAIEASLASLTVSDTDTANVNQDVADVSREVADVSESDAELAAALALSAQDAARREEELRDEQRALDEALRLSLLQK